MKPFAFKKKYRILSSKEFVSALKIKPCIYGQFFRIHIHIYQPSTDIYHTIKIDTQKKDEINNLNTNTLLRLGLVIPKRLCRQSSKRNILKRQLRENFRLNILNAEAINFSKHVKFSGIYIPSSKHHINMVFYLSKKLPEKINACLLKAIKEDIIKINQRLFKFLNNINLN